MARPSQGRAKLAACLAELLDTEAGSALTSRMHARVIEVYERWQFLDKRTRETACTGAADRRGLRGLTRQQFRAACRGRPNPRSVN